MDPSQLKSKVGHILAKAATLRVNLNIDGAPIAYGALILPRARRVCTTYFHPAYVSTGLLVLLLATQLEVLGTQLLHLQKLNRRM